MPEFMRVWRDVKPLRPKRASRVQRPPAVTRVVAPIRPGSTRAVSPGLLLQLQRQYGNRYVQRTLAISRQGEADAAPEGPQIMPVNDATVYKVSDKRAMIRNAPPALKSSGKKIPWDSQVKITQRYEKDGAPYVFVKKAYGDKADWGWTAESNIEVSDVPDAQRYGAVEATGYFTKNDKYLQQETIDALAQMDNPIEIKDATGNVTDQYHLRLTECIYPSSFSHVSKGHYTGHCVDVGFADATGAKKAYSGAAKTQIEDQGETAFDAVTKHGDHFHGCAAYPSWVNARTTARLKELIRERKSEF